MRWRSCCHLSALLPDSILFRMVLAHLKKASSTFSPVKALVSRNINSARFERDRHRIRLACSHANPNFAGQLDSENCLGPGDPFPWRGQGTTLDASAVGKQEASPTWQLWPDMKATSGPVSTSVADLQRQLASAQQMRDRGRKEGRKACCTERQARLLDGQLFMAQASCLNHGPSTSSGSRQEQRSPGARRSDLSAAQRNGYTAHHFPEQNVTPPRT